MPIVLSSTTAAGAVGIANYGDLKLQIADWLNRTDLDEAIPEFVRIAESRIRTDIKVRTQEMLTTGVLTGETLAVPDQMTEARRLIVDDRELSYVTPEQYQKLVRRSITSPPRYYTIQGESFYVLGGADGDDYTLTYWEWFDYFTDDSDTNWLLTNSPDVYLWASLEAGALYLKDYTASLDFGARYEKAVKRVMDREKDMRFSGGPLYVRSDVGE
jgi:hypothetical protein